MPFAGFPDFLSCQTKMESQGHSEDSAKRICGSLQSKLEKNTEPTGLSESELRIVNEYVQKFQKDNRPPLAWWNRCVDSVSQNSDVDSPEALCGWIFWTGRANI